MQGFGISSFALCYIWITEMYKARRMMFTSPEDSFLGSDIGLQLCCPDVDADRLR